MPTVGRKILFLKIKVYVWDICRVKKIQNKCFFEIPGHRIHQLGSLANYTFAA